MKEFIRVMKALSDPNRVKILKLLQHKSMCVCELQAVLKIAQPTVSNHLRVAHRCRTRGLPEGWSVGQLFSCGRECQPVFGKSSGKSEALTSG